MPGSLTGRAAYACLVWPSPWDGAFPPVDLTGERAVRVVHQFPQVLGEARDW